MEDWEVVQKEYEEMRALVFELEQYAALDGTEWGEGMIALCSAWYRQTFFTTKFTKLLEKEIKACLEFVKAHAKIVEHDQQFVIQRTTTLEWDEDM